MIFVLDASLILFITGLASRKCRIANYAGQWNEPSLINCTREVFASISDQVRSIWWYPLLYICFGPFRLSCVSGHYDARSVEYWRASHNWLLYGFPIAKTWVNPHFVWLILFINVRKQQMLYVLDRILFNLFNSGIFNI